MNTEKEYIVNFSSFKQHVTQSLFVLFGEIGASTDYEILKYVQQNKRAIISVPEDYYVKFYSALTLNGLFNGIECAYRIHKTTRDLTELDIELRDPTIEGALSRKYSLFLSMFINHSICYRLKVPRIILKCLCSTKQVPKIKTW